VSAPRLLLIALAGLTVVSVPAPGAEQDAAPRFRVVTSAPGPELEPHLRSAARDGFRLLASAQGVDVTGRPRITVLFERDTTGSAALDYRALACTGNLQETSTRDVLAALGEAGYRLAPAGVTARKLEEVGLPEAAYENQMVLILERDGDGQPHDFESLAFGEYEPFYRRLAALRADGYAVFGMWNTGRKLQLILQRRSASPGPSDDRPASEHRLLLMATRQVLAGKLSAAADEGFRILAAADPSIAGPPVMLLERTAAPGHRLEYGFLDDVPVKQSKDKLAKKLNRRARDGWRVAPGGTTAEVITLERPFEPSGRRSTPAEYRLLSSRRAPGLPRALEQAMHEGFEFVRLFVEPEETTVLIERSGR